MEFRGSQILELKILGGLKFLFREMKFLFRGDKKPGTAVLPLGGGQNTETVPRGWTKIF